MADAARWAAALFDDAPIGVALFDVHRRYVYVNASLAALNELPAADHLGRDPLDLFGPLVEPWVRDVDAVLLTGAPRGPYRLVPDAAPSNAYEVAFYPVRPDTGTDDPSPAGCVVALVRDVTAAHLDQRWLAVLQHGAGRLAAAGTLAEVARVATDAGAQLVDGRASFASVVPEGLRIDAMTGYPPAREEQWRGRVLPMAGRAMMVRAVRQGHPVVAEGPVEVARQNPEHVASLTEDGITSVACVPVMRGGRAVACLTFGLTHGRSFGEPLLGAMSTLVGMAATPVERVLRAHEREEQRLRDAFDAMLDLVAVCTAVRDEAGRIVDFRLAFANVRSIDPAGRALHERVGATLTELFPGLQGHPFLDALAHVVESRTPLIQEEIRYEDVIDGHPVESWWSMRISPLGDGFVSAIRDVTDAVRARAEAAEQREARQLEREAVKLLQQFALPLRLPTVRGIDLAAAHLPADADAPLGGDWYDAFTLADGRLGLVIGDVAGHGRGAAQAMIDVRRLIGGLLDDDVTPAMALALANDHLMEGDGAFATCCYAVLDVVSATVTVSLAGHPPPVLVEANGTTRLLGGQPGPPLGSLPGTVYEDAVTRIDGPATLVLYTDGLVERRGEDLADSIDALRAMVAGARGDAARVCRTVTTALAATRHDDACVLVAAVEPTRTRRTGPVERRAQRDVRPRD